MANLAKMNDALIEGHLVYWEYVDDGDAIVAYASDGDPIGKFDNMSDLQYHIKSGCYTFLEDI